MKRLMTLLLIAASLLSSAGARASSELGRGRILTGGPWVSFRSVSVLTDDDSPDGFFLGLTPEQWGKDVSAKVVRNGSGLPYALSVNFHGSAKGTFGRNWLGGCTGIAVDENLNVDTSADVPVCTVPKDAVTVEVTAYWGADLDVVVELL